MILLALLALLALPALLACTDTDHGTVVGNPGDAVARLAPVDEDLVVEEALLWADRIVPEICTDSHTVFELREGDGAIEGVVDLLGSGALGELEGGSWCRLSLEGEVLLELAGSGPGDAEWIMEVEVGQVTLHPLAADWTVDGEHYILELGQEGWLSAGYLGLEAGEDLIFEASSDQSKAVATLIAGGSALFLDLDGDGELAEDEREAGATLAGTGRSEDLGGGEGTGGGSDETGRTRGCGGAAAGVCWPLALLGLRRRLRP